MSRHRLLTAVTLTCAALGGCVGRSTGRPSDGYEAEVAALVTAVGHQRSLEGRLTGGFQFGEWHADARGISRDLQILAAAAQIQQQRRGSHANAIAALLSGDPDAAINLLERIGVESGTSASVASDLAAARLARWRQNGDAFDAVRALNEAGRAIAAQRNLAEAWFNRALALDALGLTELGRDAWRQYRDIDPSTQWSNEAAQRGERDRRDASGVSSPGGRDPLVRALAIQDLAAIRTIVNQSPQTARDYIESDLLGRWVDDHLRSLRQEDTRQGADMRLLGRLLAERHGDMLWQRMSEELDAVPRPGQAAVAQAIHRFLAARSHIEANRFDAVAPIVARLPSQLMAVPSLARSARFWALYVAWHRQNKSSIIAALSRLSTEAAAHRFGYLRARTLLLRAASMESLARYDDASQAFRDSIEEFDKLGEIEFAASGRAMLAHLLAVQGDLTEAWEQQRSALGALGRIDSSRRKIVVLANAVLLGTHHDLPYAALDIQSALIAEARRWGDHGALARYFVERARLSNDLHMPVEADAALQAGSEALRGIEDVSNRAIFELDLQIEGARALMNSNPVDASRALTNAIERLPNNSGEFKLAELYLDLGRAKRRTGASNEALQAWLSGIDVFERQRATIKVEQLRISFFSRAWELYDDAVAETLRQRQFEAALSLVERSRARALRDGLLPTPREVDVRDVASRLPSRTVILVFASTNDSLLVWCVAGTRIAFHDIPWSRAELQRQVDIVRRELTTGAIGDAVERLSAALIGPFRQQISEAAHLVVIPDGPIASLPFAALPLPAHHGSLIDTVTITIAPSISVLDVTSARLTELTAQVPRSGAFIGDPAIDRAAYPALSRLPSARSEIVESARLYPIARVFLGSEATGSALSNAIGTADVVHFAGHAVANPEFPFRATLTVAPEPGRPGFLHPTDLAGLSAGRTRLVILSACSTASASTTFGEGALSLARPFLAAGVPDVLGTLWDLDDDAAAALVPRFHRWLRAGVAPSEALRRAQLELKSGDDPRLRHPRAWSGFVIIGGIDRSLPPTTG